MTYIRQIMPKYSDLYALKYTFGVDDANKVDDHVWIGNILASMSDEFIQNFDVIINCTQDEKFYGDIKYQYRIDVHDDKKQKSINRMKQLLPEIVDKINHHINQNHKIFIHCYAGMQRSAIVIVAYLMKKHNLTKDNAIKMLKKKRPIVFTPRVNFYNSI